MEQAIRTLTEKSILSEDIFIYNVLVGFEKCFIFAPSLRKS